MPRLALVTDSTSGLAGPQVAGLGITVVPLRVIFGDEDFAEGIDISAGQVGERLRKASRVSTSRPSPRAFLQVYEKLAGEGVREILSVHLSAQLSGTCEAATLAARDAPIPVRVVDSGVVGAGLGLAALAAARLLSASTSASTLSGGVVEAAAESVRIRAEATVTLFYVHTLEFLRRGGRIGAASAFLGGALGVKPLLELTDGHIEPVEKLRTQGRALGRLHDLAVQRAVSVGSVVRLVVHHVDAAARAAVFAEKLSRSLHAEGLLDADPEVVSLPAVLAAHVGPGALGAVLSPVVGEPLTPYV